MAKLFRTITPLKTTKYVAELLIGSLISQIRGGIAQLVEHNWFFTFRSEGHGQTKRLIILLILQH